MDYSKFQLDIFDWVDKNLSQYGAVNAVAGSGKTFTGVKVLERNIKNPLFGCYNTAIRDDIRSKTRHLMFVEVNNYNSIGWRLFVGPKTLNQDKTDLAIRRILGSGYRLTDRDFKIFCKVKAPIIKLVSLGKNFCKFSARAFMNSVPEWIDFHDMEVPDEDDQVFTYTQFLTLCAAVYEDVINDRSVYDFDDQLFMPLVNGWVKPKYDFVIVDEYQDTSPMQAQTMELILKSGGRMMIFGDPDQSIYEFRGALPDAFGNWTDRFNATKLPLSICYRCPIAVVQEAQKIVPRIQWAPNAKQGTFGHLSEEDYFRKVRDGDFVICRTTQQLVSDCLKFNQQGRKAVVRGKEIGEGLIAIINQVTDGIDCTIENFNAKLKDWVKEKMTRLQALHQDTKIEKLDEKIQTIEIFLDQVSQTSTLKDKIVAQFADNPEEGIQLMTAHKSKGLQNP